MLFMANFGLN